MIISDGPLHKVDASYDGTEGYLSITTFHRPNPNSFDWSIKVMRLHPDVQTKLVELILAKAKESAAKPA